MSHWLYIHRDTSGEEGVWKIGVTIHPGNVVRKNQRTSWRKCVIDHLYFGKECDINEIETLIKQAFKHLTGRSLLEYGCQTELLKIDIHTLLAYIDKLIVYRKYSIKKLPLSSPYFGTNVRNCSLGLPPEKDCGEDFEIIANEIFGYYDYRAKFKSPTANLNTYFNV